MIEAIAMSLYQYNVDPGTRASLLFGHFKGACAEIHDLLAWVDDHCWATKMPYPTAKVYLEQAMARYGTEAERRIACEEGL